MPQEPITISWRDPAEWGPPVFELRNIRLFAGDGGLTQLELANLAGISPRRLRSYEGCRALPESVHALLSLAIALRVPFEYLIEPRVLDELKAAIEVRRVVIDARTRRRNAPQGEPPA